MLRQFVHGRWCLLCHEVDGILITQPVGTLDGVVHVPPPVVFLHVAQCSVEATLCSAEKCKDAPAEKRTKSVASAVIDSSSALMVGAAWPCTIAMETATNRNIGCAVTHGNPISSFFFSLHPSFFIPPPGH